LHLANVFALTEYRDADKSLARPTSRCILFDGENISFDASLVIHINSTNIPPIMIISRIYFFLLALQPIVGLYFAAL
jgi:hypothetical protein